MPTHSYIWDVNSPNEPEYTLTPPSPACCLSFNAKSPDWIVGGCYNGLIGTDSFCFDSSIDFLAAFWDSRKQGTVETSLIETSHCDPVYDVQWIQSRSNQECVSIGTDGFVKWWDVRKLTGGSSRSFFLFPPSILFDQHRWTRFHVIFPMPTLFIPTSKVSSVQITCDPFQSVVRP